MIRHRQALDYLARQKPVERVVRRYKRNFQKVYAWVKRKDGISHFSACILHTIWSCNLQIHYRQLHALSCCLLKIQRTRWLIAFDFTLSLELEIMDGVVDVVVTKGMGS
jgi:hypothetical protein